MAYFSRVLVLMLVVLALGCTSSLTPTTPKARRVNYAALAAAERPQPPTPPERVHALLINGGGGPQQNYASHLEHIRKLVAVLQQAGVDASHISILSGDGSDPSPDLAVGVPKPEGSWLLSGVPAGDDLLERMNLQDSTLPGFELRPATVGEIKKWFRSARTKLRNGDTLLLYVTDHGTRNPRDVLDNRIILWGEGASMSVRELRAILRTVRPSVRVVLLMSQCFSGGFAWLGREDGERTPVTNVCGYFSSRFDMAAHGCYADLASAGEEGHSFAFMRALGRTGGFGEAHRATLITDRTPDVPLRTSDLWLQDLLHDVADAARTDIPQLTDTLLTEAWENTAAWEPEMRLLDRLGQVYGFPSPHSKRGLERLVRQFSRAREEIKTHSRAWSSALDDATQGTWLEFLSMDSRRLPQLRDIRAAAMGSEKRKESVQSLFQELVEFAAKRGETFKMTKTLDDRITETDALAFRTSVRIAALLRAGTILSSIAGRVYLSAHADPQLFTAYRTMRACEDLSFEELPQRSADDVIEEPGLMPTVEADTKIMARATPSWLGVRTRAVNADKISQEKLARGSALVLGFDIDSPGKSAGLRHGDILLGPPGKPFAHPHDFLPWSVFLEVGKPQGLVFRRGNETFTATVVPRAFPFSSEETEDRSIGRIGAPVQGAFYRGTPPASGRRLLFFWATWCAPCKAMIPELLEYSDLNHVPIIAITDESSEQLDTFFRHWTDPFPFIVVSDENRQSFRDYGVSGTPTAILLDGESRIRAVQRGYSRRVGVRLP